MVRNNVPKSFRSRALGVMFSDSWWGSFSSGEGGWNIGLGEVVPFEEERFAGHLRECIGEAVTEVQPSRVSALSKIRIRLSCNVRLFLGDGFDGDISASKQRVALLEDFSTELTLDDD